MAENIEEEKEKLIASSDLEKFMFEWLYPQHFAVFPVTLPKEVLNNDQDFFFYKIDKVSINKIKMNKYFIF